MAGHAKTIEKREGPYREEGFPLMDSEAKVTAENRGAVAVDVRSYCLARSRDLVEEYKGTAKEGTYLALAMDVCRKEQLMQRDEAMARKQEAKDAEDAGGEPGGEADSARSGLSADFGAALRAAVPDDDADADRGAGEAEEA